MGGIAALRLSFFLAAGWLIGGRGHMRCSVALLTLALWGVALSGLCGLPRRAEVEQGVMLKRVQTFSGFHRGSFSPDGRLLALVDGAHTDVVEAGSGRTLARLKKPNSSFLRARFLPDARSLATVYRVEDGAGRATVRVTFWDALSGREKLSLPAEDQDWRRVVDLSFSSDGRLLGSNVGGIARLWEVSTGREVRRFVPEGGPPDQQAERALLSPDGKWLAAYFISPNERAYKMVRVWDLQTGRPQEFEADLYEDWEFSADSKLLALTAITDKGRPDERSVAEIWDASAGRRLQAIEVPREWRGAYTVAFAPDSGLLAVGGYKKFGVFSTDTGRLLASETHHGGGFWQDSEMPNQIERVEFSPDGKLLLTGGNDNTVKLWRVERQ